jgi:hypothetical protein
LTFPDVARLISSLTGHTIRYEPLPESEAEKVWGHDFGVMFKWFNHVGYNADIAALEKQHKIKLIRFKDWLKDSVVVKELKEEAAVH